MRLLVFLSIVFVVSMSWAQGPFINGIDKTATYAGDTITISGFGFASNVFVFFGNGQATTLPSISEDRIRAVVPPTATYGPIRVIDDVAEGLAGTSIKNFNLAFSGGTIADNTVESLQLSGAGNLLAYDLCMCDFDGDEDLDIIYTNAGTNNLILATNNSTLTTSSFAISEIPNANTSYNIECADLNADGRPDFVTTSSDATEPFVHIYENQGSMSFTKRHRFTAPQLRGDNRILKKVQLADMDGDGKIDIILGNQRETDEAILIYQNVFTADVAFNNTPTLVTIPGAGNTGGLDVGDLNSDGRPDLAVVAFRDAGPLYIVENRSTPGNLSFGAAKSFGSTSERLNVAIGDFNDDGQNDVATTRGTDIEVFQNDGGLNFTAGASIISASGINPWGIDLGDFNGDGRVDVVASSVSDEVIIAPNTTTSGGDISFGSPQRETTEELRNVRVGDLNGDAKPDIAGTDRSLLDIEGGLRVITNRNCFIPEINAPGTAYCDDPFIVRANLNPGVSYEWFNGGTSLGTGSSVDISGEAANFTLTLNTSESDASGCTGSDNVALIYTPGTIPAPNISFTEGTANACAGDNLELTASGSGTSFTWTLPDGSVVNNSGVLALNEIQPNEAGIYKVVYEASGCTSVEDQVSITVQSPPNATIAVTGCSGGFLELAVPNFPGVTYQWFRNGSTPVGTAPTLDVDQAGDYTVTLDDGCTFTTAAVVIVAPPASSFDGPDFQVANTACVGSAVDFFATSTGVGDLVYNWEFETPGGLITTDDTNSDTVNFTFAEAGNWKVRLNTEYANEFGCDTQEKTIVVSDPPSFTISNPSGTTEKCPNDVIDLELNDPSIVAWTWSDGTTTPTVGAQVPQGQTSEDYTLTVLTENGCAVTTPAVTISNFSNSGIPVTSPDASIVNDTINLEDGEPEVTLIASNSIDGTYSWEPANLFNTTGSTVTFVPNRPIITVTVTATDAAGCVTTTTVVVQGGGLRPNKSFSPNGDMLGNDCWEIVNANGLVDCTVQIFDSRGRNLVQIPSVEFQDDCVWDGNVSGAPAPEGVYYFVLQCADGSQNQSGSILLAR